MHDLATTVREGFDPGALITIPGQKSLAFVVPRAIEETQRAEFCPEFATLDSLYPLPNHHVTSVVLPLPL